MRSFEEIEAEVRRAVVEYDASLLRVLSHELQQLDDSLANAAAWNTLGEAERLEGNHQNALQHYHQALSMYEELGSQRDSAAVLGNIGIIQFNLGNYREAIEHQHRALAIHRRYKNRSGEAAVLGNIGMIHISTGEYAQALKYYHHTLALHEELGDRRSVGIGTGNIGIVHSHTGNYPLALQHLYRALAIHREHKNQGGIASATNGIATVHFRLGDYNEALGFLHESLVLNKEIGDLRGVASSMANIGLIHDVRGDHTEAQVHYQQALALHEQLGDRAGVASVLCNIIDILIQQEAYDEAAKLLDTQELLPMDEPDIRANHLGARALVAEQMGDHKAANDYLTHGLQIAIESGLRGKAVDIHKLLREMAQRHNDFEAYIHHNDEYLRITEEIRGKEATQRMAMMEAERRMEGERREREKERALLYGTLPKDVAERMIRGEVINDRFENAAVLFADIAGFTTHTSSMDPAEVTELLERLFSAFDALCDEHGVVKVKTIGDSYLCFAHSVLSPDPSHPRERGDDVVIPSASEERIAAVALAMQSADFYWPTATANSNSNRIQLRIGIHSGPVSAGVIGTQRLQYDIWGDTVNVASRMESTGEPGKIQVSSEFHEQLSSQAQSPVSEFWSPKFTERGEVNIKGKGTMTTYWLEGA